MTASAENNLGRAPLEVKLSSQGTFDKDANDQLNYEWRLIDAAQPAAAPVVLSKEASPSVTIDKPGVFNVELVVTTAADHHVRPACRWSLAMTVPTCDF